MSRTLSVGKLPSESGEWEIQGVRGFGSEPRWWNVSNFFYIVARRGAAADPTLAKRPDPPRVLASGHVARLLIGHGYGFIRLPDGREVYFHRAEMGQDMSFNSLQVGDPVIFELFDDRVSGARALRVMRRRRN